MTERERYAEDQLNAARQSGTTKGKQAVRDFLLAMEERVSDGAMGSEEWGAGPARRLQLVIYYFLKYMAEIPPWGSPEYNEAVVGVLLAPGHPIHVICNLFGTTEQDLRFRALVFNTVKRQMALQVRYHARVLRKRWFRRVFHGRRADK